MNEQFMGLLFNKFFYYISLPSSGNMHNHNSIGNYLTLVLLIITTLACQPLGPPSVQNEFKNLPEVVDFNFHIKPILSDRCFTCHGPDENERKADLRLDIETNAKQKLASGNGHAIVPGKPHKSQAVTHLLSDDPDLIMPPPNSNLSLTDREKALIIKWIDQGAEWKEHWSFIKPKPAKVPEVVNGSWTIHNEIDLFIQAKLEDYEMQPSEVADPERLLRRVYFDLTGLPPSSEEMEVFSRDPTYEAYESVVDQLLASQAFGERMAMDWLDLSRYADSHGLHADGWRMMWPWRDWVIKSFNENMPYDQFVTWQIAGDLFEEATFDQKLATAFCRNHTMTAEGGVIDEEFRLSYVYDRTETVATAFLGLTLGCAKCHDHKYDPISQKEYFEMTAFFNNVRELGMTGDDGNYGPTLLYTDGETREKIKSISKSISEKEKLLESNPPKAEKVKEYIESLREPTELLSRDMLAHLSLDKMNKATVPDGRDFAYFDGNKEFKSYGNVAHITGKEGKAIELTEDYSELHINGLPHFEMIDPFSVNMWIHTYQSDPKKTQTLIGNSGDKNNFWRGWEFYLDESNRLSAKLISSLPHNLIHVSCDEVIQPGQWYNVGLTYDGSGSADGLNLYVNGQALKPTIHYNRLYKSILPVRAGDHRLTDRALKVGKSGRLFTGESGIFYGMIDEIRIFNRVLTPMEFAILSERPLDDIVKNELALPVHEDRAFIVKELHDLRKEKLKMLSHIPEVMIMEEDDQIRDTYMYERGEYQHPRDKVQMNTPGNVLSFPENFPKNRLGLSQWIFHEDNPLTARVAVNRYWQMIFGKGLVDTPQDFGQQGSLPSHPAMLDWLALDFMNSGWDIKKLIKKMVVSATYRQSSKLDPDQYEKDPDNILLARGPSYRLPAEMIRDNALAASGLINKKIGGESVKPYQPEGLWIELGNFSHKLLRYKADQGDSLYRRSIYTFIRRTSPPPMMTTFDVPNREVCVVERESTNTPLQSLVLMNDPQFVEAAKVLAIRSREIYEHPEEQIIHAFKSSTGRTPNEKEIAPLKSFYKNQYDKYLAHPYDAQKLLDVGAFETDNPEFELNDELASTAAMVMVANTILNHDDTYTKR